jgi:hypothetical protein
MATRRAYQQPMAGAEGFAGTRKVIGVASVPIATADLVTGGVVIPFVVPPGFVCTGINMTVPDMDTGATLTISVGDSGSAARLVSASTAGQAGGSITALAATGQYYKFPVQTEILITFPAGPAGATAGSITNFYLEGFVAS